MESYPHESAVAHPDGSFTTVLAVSEPAWLERLLLTLGPDARVEAPSDLVTLGADAARRLRRRYVES
jgi:predicted DNA-binding transcriptional regulator YafY